MNASAEAKMSVHHLHFYLEPERTMEKLQDLHFLVTTRRKQVWSRNTCFHEMIHYIILHGVCFFCVATTHRERVRTEHCRHTPPCFFSNAHLQPPPFFLLSLGVNVCVHPRLPLCTVWVTTCLCECNSATILSAHFSYLNRSADYISRCLLLLYSFAVSQFLCECPVCRDAFSPSSPSQSHVCGSLKIPQISLPSLCLSVELGRKLAQTESLPLSLFLPPAKEEMRCVLQQSFCPSHLSPSLSAPCRTLSLFLFPWVTSQKENHLR